MMMIAGSNDYIDMYTFNVIENGCYFRELSSIYYMALGRKTLEEYFEKEKR